MHDLTLVFLFILVVVILIVSWSYATSSAAAIGSSEDPELIIAHSYLAWTVSILAIIIVGMFIAIICLVIFGPEFLPTFGKTIVYLALFIMLIALIAVGIIAAIASVHIGRATDVNTGDAYRDAIIAAVVALAPLIIVIIGYVITWYHSKHVEPTDGPYDDAYNNQDDSY